MCRGGGQNQLCLIKVLPLTLAAGGSWGDAGLLGVCVSAGVGGTGTGEGCWAGGGDT